MLGALFEPFSDSFRRGVLGSPHPGSRSLPFASLSQRSCHALPVGSLVGDREGKEEAMSTNPQDGSQPTVVLVHGAWADGSGWRCVYNRLKDDYSVRIVQNPTLSLEGDV